MNQVIIELKLSVPDKISAYEILMAMQRLVQGDDKPTCGLVAALSRKAFVLASTVRDRSGSDGNDSHPA